ncbi:hypothetical protein [Labrenzia sp. PHM005]|uniref:hypothetical protein n=1 Tax=Labrenzia sp. PHM005 TaxID=2590016 RepID=UPI0011404532|nr:hypothetical protein [Labrenzia sp. PHM005]QDG74557.1 hypothetical protein FJ695_00985 [Labrenzia sp. PHM005]
MSFAFNETFYLANNPDVAEAVAAGTVASAEEHYNLFGWSEGRDPNEHFDTSFYLSENPDVAAAGVNPFHHFLTYGAAEGRVPNPTIDALLGYPAIGEGDDVFDSATYLAANPDVQAAVDAGQMTAYQHWILHGQFENRPGAQTLSGTDLSGGNSDTPLGIGDGDDGDAGAGGGGGGGGGASPTGNTILLEAGASQVLVGGVPVNATNSATDLGDTIYSTFDNADLSVIDAGDGDDTLIITGFNTFAIDDVRTNDASDVSDQLDMDLTSVENIIFEDAIGEVDIEDKHNGENIEVQGASGALEAVTKADGQTLLVGNTSGSFYSEITLSNHTGLSVTLGASDDLIDELQTSDAYIDAGGGDDLIVVTAEAAETATILGGDGNEDALIIDADITADTHYVFTNVSGVEYLDIYEDDTHTTTVDLFDGVRFLGVFDGSGPQDTWVNGTADRWNSIYETNFEDTGAAKTLVLTAAGDIDFSRYDVDLSNLGNGGAGGVLLSSGNDSLKLDADNACAVRSDDGLINGGDGTDTLIMADALKGGSDLDAVRNFETIELAGGAQTFVIADETTASGAATSIDASALTDGLMFVGIFETDGTLGLTGSDFGDDISLGAGADTAALGSGDDVLRIFEVENGTLVFGGDAISGFTVGVDASSGDSILFSIDDVDADDTASLSFSTIHGDGANSDIGAAVDRGLVSVLEVAADAGAVADAAEHQIINFTDTSATSFSEAIGTGTVNVNNGAALSADTSVLVSYFDADLETGSAVIGYVDDLGVNNLLDSTDAVNIIGSIEMSAGDYANFAANSLMFDSF